MILGGILIMGWQNTSNDLFDSMTGVDANKRESFVNVTGSRPLVLGIALVTLLLGVALLWGPLTSCSDPRAALFVSLAVVLGYVYQGPPFRLSYKGLGEPLCFLAFGPLATTGFYLACLPRELLAAGGPLLSAFPLVAAKQRAAAQFTQVPELAWLCACFVGATTSLILLCSHFHQEEGDRRSGKLSPVVRLGLPRATQVLKYSVVLTLLGPAPLAVQGGSAAGASLFVAGVWTYLLFG